MEGCDVEPPRRTSVRWGAEWTSGKGRPESIDTASNCRLALEMAAQGALECAPGLVLERQDCATIRRVRSAGQVGRKEDRESMSSRATQRSNITSF